MTKFKITIAAALLMLTMAGCQNKAVQETETASVETSVAETASVAETETAAVDKEVKAFAERIVKAVKAKDLDELIKLSAFPVYISVVETNSGVVESIEEFGEVDPDKIFTDEYVKSVTSYDLNKLKKSEAGYVIGEGRSNVIFRDKDGGFEIVGINVK